MTVAAEVPPGSPPTEPPRRGGGLLAAAIILAGANLRPAVASVGPVLDDIRADLGLSAAAASFLTALPILCFGGGAVLAPRLARRFGTEMVLVAVLATTTAGLAVRTVPGWVALYLGTFMAGASIAVANVLIPAIIKREFSHRAGLMMGLYISVTAVTASIAAAVTVPIAEAFGIGWRAGLGAWAVPAAAAVALWVVVTATRRRRSAPDDRTTVVPASMRRDPVALQVTAFMGAQSIIFYTMLAWLPSVYRSYGMEPDVAGRLLSLSLFIAVPAGLVIPSLLARAASQSRWAVGTSAFVAAGALGLLLAPRSAPYLWATLLGTGMGTAFPLSITLVVLRSRNAQDAAQLSAMSQTAGYLLAAVGPFVFGLLHDLTDGWTVPFAFILLLLVPQVITGHRAGRPVFVRDVAPAG